MLYKNIFDFRYGRIELPPSSLLIKCPNNINLCGKYSKVEAPCSYVSKKYCKWNNISYQDVRVYF